MHFFARFAKTTLVLHGDAVLADRFMDIGSFGVVTLDVAQKSERSGQKKREKTKKAVNKGVRWPKDAGALSNLVRGGQTAKKRL